MTVFTQQGLIFVHIPKTGGESISEALKNAVSAAPSWSIENYHYDEAENHYRLFHKEAVDLLNSGKHLTAQQIRGHVGEDVFDRCYKFSIVRNPWEHVVSYYHHLRKPLYMNGMKGRLLRPHNACKLAQERDFTDWVEEIYKKRQIQDEASREYFPVDHFNSQSAWILDESGKLLVDYVCRFEALAEGLSAIQGKINLPFEKYLTHSNRSRHKHYTTYYDEQSREIISCHFRKDIELFGYKFGSP